jgi:hypothetical protein
MTPSRATHISEKRTVLAERYRLLLLLEPLTLDAAQVVAGAELGGFIADRYFALAPYGVDCFY